MRTKRWLTGFILFLLLRLAFADGFEPILGSYARSRFAISLLNGFDDLRSGFYELKGRDLESSIRRGSCLIVISGGAEGSPEILTNECPTVEQAVIKCAQRGTVEQRQIRVIQADTVFQTPLPNHADSNARRAVLAARLEAGDVIVIAGDSKAAQETDADRNLLNGFARSLLAEATDLRQNLYAAGAEGLDDYKEKGLFMMMTGSVVKGGKGPGMRELLGIPASECPTIESAILKHSYPGTINHNQLAIVQMNAIFQTSFQMINHADARKAFLSRRPVPGDFLVVRGLE